MKKIIFIWIISILIFFLIPIMFANKFKTVETFSKSNNQSKIEEIEIDKSYDYSNYTTIKLMHTITNEIQEVNLEEYLCNVVAAEMPAEFDEEALKAQAVVARTYTIYTIIKNKGKHEQADICDSPNCCQAWISKEERLLKWEENEREKNWNKIVNAVNSTVGEIIMYDKKIINAVYHANSGGKTEKANFVWEGNEYPYLQSIETSRRRKI